MLHRRDELSVQILQVKAGMNITWFEDYIALVECANFTKAAESRFVTQPAFSRRIKSLESWLGVALVDRNAYPMALTELGHEYVTPIKNLLRDIYGLRTEMQSRSKKEEQLVISTQHTLGITYCPNWFSLMQPFFTERETSNGSSGVNLRVDTGDLYDCIDKFMARNCDLLLCYYTPSLSLSLNNTNLRKLELGNERLLPVCGIDKHGSPLFSTKDTKRLPMIGFTNDSFFGDIILRDCILSDHGGIEFDIVYETALSDGIKSMVLQGNGMAWLPMSLVANELKQGVLKQMDGLATSEMSIMLYAHSSNSSKLITSFWSFLEATYNR